MTNTTKMTDSTLSKADKLALDYVNASIFWREVTTGLPITAKVPTWKATKEIIQTDRIGEDFARRSGFYPSKMPLRDVWKANSLGVVAALGGNLVTAWDINQAVGFMLRKAPAFCAVSSAAWGLGMALSTILVCRVLLRQTQQAALERTFKIRSIRQTAINNPATAPR